MGKPVRKKQSINTSISKPPLEKNLCKKFYQEFKQLKALNYFKSEVFIFHIANEQYTNIGYTRNLTAMGLTAGVADYCVLMPLRMTAFIEFKRSPRCKQTAAQIDFQQVCERLDIPYLLTSEPVKALKWIKNLIIENSQSR